MRFTATVKNREVVIRDVMLPDGDVVEVTIEKQLHDEWEPSPAELREIELGEADIAAGRVMTIDEFVASQKRSAELRRQDREARRRRGGTRSRKVGSARPRSKSTAGTARRGR